MQRRLELACALVHDPALADDRRATHRYNADCAAALAMKAPGPGTAPIDDATRRGLRAQALGWLQAELSAWGKALDSGDPGARKAVAKALTLWKTDTDLAGLREADALAMLPEDERADWQALWSQVAALLGRAEAKSP